MNVGPIIGSPLQRNFEGIKEIIKVIKHKSLLH
jgi:hypothetical protein